MSKRSRSHGLDAIQSSLLWPPGLRSTCLGPAASESGSAVSPRRASRGDLAGQDAPGRGTHRGSTGRGRARVPLGVLGAGASRKTRAGRPRAGPFGVDARRRTHVRAAARPLPRAQPKPGSGPGTARRRTGRPGLPRGGAAARIVPPERPASPPLGPGRGAGPPQPWNVGSRPAFVSRARTAVAPRQPLQEPRGAWGAEPTGEASTWTLPSRSSWSSFFRARW